MFKAKAELLYTYLSIPYNLTTWFAKEVNIEGNVYHVSWGFAGEHIKEKKSAFKKYIIYEWIDREGNEELSFELTTDEVTGGTMLVVSDYDDADQEDESRMWWENTINKLKRTVGG